jgi:hypothetical protein
MILVPLRSGQEREMALFNPPRTSSGASPPPVARIFITKALNSAIDFVNGNTSKWFSPINANQSIVNF